MFTQTLITVHLSALYLSVTSHHSYMLTVSYTLRSYISQHLKFLTWKIMKYDYHKFMVYVTVMMLHVSLRSSRITTVGCCMCCWVLKFQRSTPWNCSRLRRTGSVISSFWWSDLNKVFRENPSPSLNVSMNDRHRKARTHAHNVQHSK